MTGQAEDTTDEGRDAADQAADEARDVVDSRPMRLAARVGLVANGFVHLLIAWLAVRVASGQGGRADQGGAMQALAAEPFGRVLLWLLAAAFVAVMIWRTREAIWGHRRHEGRRQQKRDRLYSAAQVVVFGALAVLAARVAAGGAAGNGGQGPTTALLSLPAGRWLIVAVGVGAVITGVVIVYQGYHLAFIEDMDLRGVHPWVRRIAERAGQTGFVAKGFAVGAIGVLVAAAGVTSQPGQAEGLDAALKALAGQPSGDVVLYAVAFGFAAYAVFCVVDARYHRV